MESVALEAAHRGGRRRWGGSEERGGRVGDRRRGEGVGGAGGWLWAATLEGAEPFRGGAMGVCWRGGTLAPPGQGWELDP